MPATETISSTKDPVLQQGPQELEYFVRPGGPAGGRSL